MLLLSALVMSVMLNYKLGLALDNSARLPLIFSCSSIESSEIPLLPQSLLIIVLDHRYPRFSSLLASNSDVEHRAQVLVDEITHHKHTLYFLCFQTQTLQ